MNEYLPFVSIDIWTTIFSWVNLLILFLLLKRFLFKPVNKILSDRAAEIEGAYREAEDSRREAEDIRIEYDKKLMSAGNEADSIIKSAVDAASRRSESIISDAEKQAKIIEEHSRALIAKEKSSALESVRADVASMAVDIAERLVRRSLNEEDDEKLISDIIDKI